MMPEGYKENRAFADNWNPALSQIITENIATIATVKAAAHVADKRTCTDFVVTTSSGNTIAARIRRPDVSAKFRDFTLRAKAGGARTELEKIRDGYGDWFIYAWTGDRGAVIDWMLVDLNKMRSSGLLATDRKVIDNTDGETGFVAFKRSELRAADCLAKEMRHGTYTTCGYGQHSWQDVMADGRKKVVCATCGTFAGYYGSPADQSCIGKVVLG